MNFFCATLSKNQGKYLSDCINSVLSQSSLEKYVVYDLSSWDETDEILSKYKGKFSVISVKSDLGPSDGLNKCLNYNNSEIFCYLNADDVFAPGAFDYVTRIFQEFPEIDILHGSIMLMDSYGTKYKILLASKFSLRRYAFRVSIVNQQATFIRSRVLSNDAFNIDNRINWDGELIVDLVKSGAKVKHVHKVLGYFRIHPTSITSSIEYKTSLKKQHRKIELKILGRPASFVEKVFSLIFSKFLALGRLVKVKILPKTYFTNLEF